MLQVSYVAFALLALLLNLNSATGAAIKRRSLGPAQPCSPDVCKLPDCWCSGTDIPGNLPKDKVPQMIMLSFDDAINGQVIYCIHDIHASLHQQSFPFHKGSPRDSRSGRPAIYYKQSLFPLRESRTRRTRERSRNSLAALI